MSYQGLQGREGEEPPVERGRSSRVGSRTPCGPGGPQCLHASYAERKTSVLARIKIACRALIEEGTMPTTRKVAARAPCGTSTLGRGRHAKVFQRYRRFAELKGLGSAGKRENQPTHEGCAGCRKRDTEIAKMRGDISRLVRIAGALRKLVRWHRRQMAKSRAVDEAESMPELARRPRISRSSTGRPR